MTFTYKAYQNLLSLLKDGGYAFVDYHDYQSSPRCVILRHDIDQSIEKSLALARLEAEAGVKATYFVLLTSDFYNAASARSLAGLAELRRLGHEVGLHFDEVAYEQAAGAGETVQRILRERDILSALLRTEVTTVSMHRPSKATLEADLQIPGMVNSYGQTFFHDFKYLSDSRRRWREPVEEIIRGGEYDRLHILTHAFWYHENEESIEKTLETFILSAKRERYGLLAENIRDIDSLKIKINYEK